MSTSSEGSRQYSNTTLDSTLDANVITIAKKQLYVTQQTKMAMSSPQLFITQIRWKLYSNTTLDSTLT
jgi:hypothetical protein